jgi:protoporphyrinogen oxidase
MTQNLKKTAIIIGAGPGGLTAAYELSTRTDIIPIILEQSNEIGGISRTVNHNGNRIDIGGHRFFSKSDRVMKWWQMFMPVESEEFGVKHQEADKVMLLRNRLSRIYFLRKFFDYPITLSLRTIKNLGALRLLKITFSYTKIRLFPLKTEGNLEDFFINRFGNELYLTFFKDYTEKVWGVPCDQIKAEWGAQRIKGLSISKAIKHALKSCWVKNKELEQKKVETSLIERFMYPKYGPGQLWETVAETLVEGITELKYNMRVSAISWLNQEEVRVDCINTETGLIHTFTSNYLFSTMPIKGLIDSLGVSVPEHVKRIAGGLVYRDFITVGLLLSKLKLENPNSHNNLVPDNWIYIQEKDVQIGRLQIFNNWSPYLVADQKNVWLGLEYFCNEGDEVWSMEDNELMKFAASELEKIDIIENQYIVDSVVIRVPKAYPAYFGSYAEINHIVEYTDTFANMFLIGRNGMHKYNNQDHSMLTAMTAVDNIVKGISTKENIWKINTEDSYHEEAS